MTYLIVALLAMIVLLLWGVCGLLWRITQRLETLNKDFNELTVPIEWVEKAIRDS